MKLIDVNSKSEGEETREIILESDSITELKNACKRLVINACKELPEWEDRTPPTMGNEKLADRKVRFVLAISEHHYFLIEK